MTPAEILEMKKKAEERKRQEAAQAAQPQPTQPTQPPAPPAPVQRPTTPPTTPRSAPPPSARPVVAAPVFRGVIAPNQPKYKPPEIPAGFRVAPDADTEPAFPFFVNPPDTQPTDLLDTAMASGRRINISEPNAAPASPPAPPRTGYAPGAYPIPVAAQQVAAQTGEKQRAEDELMAEAQPLALARSREILRDEGVVATLQAFNGDADRYVSERARNLMLNGKSNAEARDIALTELGVLRTAGVWSGSAVLSQGQGGGSIYEASKPQTELVGVVRDGARLRPVFRQQSPGSYAFDVLTAPVYAATATGVPDEIAQAIAPDPNFRPRTPAQAIAERRTFSDVARSAMPTSTMGQAAFATVGALADILTPDPITLARMGKGAVKGAASLYTGAERAAAKRAAAEAALDAARKEEIAAETEFRSVMDQGADEIADAQRRVDDAARAERDVLSTKGESPELVAARKEYDAAEEQLKRLEESRGAELARVDARYENAVTRLQELETAARTATRAPTIDAALSALNAKNIYTTDDAIEVVTKALAAVKKTPIAGVINRDIAQAIYTRITQELPADVARMIEPTKELSGAVTNPTGLLSNLRTLESRGMSTLSPDQKNKVVNIVIDETERILNQAKRTATTKLGTPYDIGVVYPKTLLTVLPSDMQTAIRGGQPVTVPIGVLDDIIRGAGSSGRVSTPLPASVVALLENAPIVKTAAGDTAARVISPALVSKIDNLLETETKALDKIIGTDPVPALVNVPEPILKIPKDVIDAAIDVVLFPLKGFDATAAFTRETGLGKGAEEGFKRMTRAIDAMAATISKQTINNVDDARAVLRDVPMPDVSSTFVATTPEGVLRALFSTNKIANDIDSLLRTSRGFMGFRGGESITDLQPFLKARLDEGVGILDALDQFNIAKGGSVITGESYKRVAMYVGSTGASSHALLDMFGAGVLLTPDEAIALGDIDYMFRIAEDVRTAKKKVADAALPDMPLFDSTRQKAMQKAQELAGKMVIDEQVAFLQQRFEGTAHVRPSAIQENFVPTQSLRDGKIVKGLLDTDLFSPAGTKALDNVQSAVWVPQSVLDRIGDAAVRGAKPDVNAVVNPLSWMRSMWQRSVTRGLLTAKPGYLFNNTWGNIEQVYVTMGFGTALKYALRSELQSLAGISVAAAPALTGLGGAARVALSTGMGTKLGKRLVDGLLDAAQRGGEQFTAFIHKTSTYPGVADILKAGDGTIVLGDRVYTYRDLYRIAVEEGVLDSFDVSMASEELIASKAGEIMGLPAEGVQHLAEAIGIRQRIGLYATLIDNGLTPKEAGRGVVGALYDYKHSMAPADRNVVVQTLFPFWTWQKNAQRQMLGALDSPWGAYRMGAFLRARRTLTDMVNSWDRDYDGNGVGVGRMPADVLRSYNDVVVPMMEKHGITPGQSRNDFIMQWDPFESANRLLGGTATPEEIKAFNEAVQSVAQFTQPLGGLDAAGGVPSYARDRAILAIGDDNAWGLALPPSGMEAGISFAAGLLATAARGAGQLAGALYEPAYRYTGGAATPPFWKVGQDYVVDPMKSPPMELVRPRIYLSETTGNMVDLMLPGVWGERIAVLTPTNYSAMGVGASVIADEAERDNVDPKKGWVVTNPVVMAALIAAGIVSADREMSRAAQLPPDARAAVAAGIAAGMTQIPLRSSNAEAVRLERDVTARTRAMPTMSPAEQKLSE